MKITILATMAIGAGLCGCAQEPIYQKEFGVAYRQAIVSQIADPDAVYRGDPAPGANGSRAALAQERYRTGKVLAPNPPRASTVGGDSAAMAPQ